MQIPLIVLLAPSVQVGPSSGVDPYRADALEECVLGDRVVYRASFDGGAARLYLALEPVGLPPLELAAPAGGVREGVRFAGERWVVYRAAETAGGAVELFGVAADGSGEPRRLSEAGVTVTDFQLAPGAARAVYRVEAGGLWSCALDGSEEPRAQVAGPVAWYALGADGDTLVWSATADSAVAEVLGLATRTRRSMPRASALALLGAAAPGGTRLPLSTGPASIAGPGRFHQAPDQLIGTLPNYTYHSVFGDVSFNGVNLVYAGLESGGSSIVVVDNVHGVTTSTLISSLGVLGVNNFIQLAISNSGSQVAVTGITVSGVGSVVFMSFDSGVTWQYISLPLPVLGTALAYDTLISASPGHSFGLQDSDFQKSLFYGADGNLYLYTYLEASAATSDTDRLALVEYMFAPGSLTPSSRVIFTVNSAPGCVSTAQRYCYINAVPTDSGVMLIDGAGAWWSGGGAVPSTYNPRYAFIGYGGSSAVQGGFIGETLMTTESIKDDEIALAYMGRSSQGNEEFAFLRRKGNTAYGNSYAVSKLTLSGGLLPDTHPFGVPLTDLSSTLLANAGIPTTDLAPLLGGNVGFRTVRDIAANRQTGKVTVFLFGPPDPVIGQMEIDDITSVRFVPGSPVTPSMRSFVNDFTAAKAANLGLNLDTSTIGFDVCSRPDGKITTFFTGSLIPNPFGPHTGKIFYQTW